MITVNRIGTPHASSPTTFSFQWLTHSTGAQSEGSAPQINSLAVHQLTFYHFYPVAEKAQAPKSRWTGFGSEQPECAARQTATPKFAQCNDRIKNPIELKVLKVLRGLLLKKSPKWGAGQSPATFRDLKFFGRNFVNGLVYGGIFCYNRSN